ncbi:MAG: chromate transporter [Spirochaetaceae bacterium]|nr:chromate transporter [Spirochaetaceae bacterium]
MNYLWLFLIFLRTGALSFGGGYVILSLLSDDFYYYLTPAQTANLIAISSAAPGAISINAATYFGLMVGSQPQLAALMAVVGLVIPSVAASLIAYKFFSKFKNSRYLTTLLMALKPVVAGMVFFVGIRILWDEAFIGRNLQALGIFLLVMALLMVRTKIMVVILAGAMLGLFSHLLMG